MSHTPQPFGTPQPKRSTWASTQLCAEKRINACHGQIGGAGFGSLIDDDPIAQKITRIATERSEDAFRQLFAQFAPRITGYMMRRGADAATAEELAQETLLTVWRKAGLYSSDKGPPATWIFTIARNLRINSLRKEACWQELSNEHTESIPSDDAAPDDAASERQRQARVQAVLAALPEDQREVIALAFIDGLSQSEIAGRLALPLGTVKSRTRLAYQKVRDALQDLK